MIKVNILKNNIVTNSGQFDNQDLANIWIAQEIANNSWGLPERPELDNQRQPTGNTLPAEYTIEQIDLGNTPQMSNIRAKRDSLLSACDWTQLADSPLASDKKTAWAIYRQALRDLPAQNGLDPNNPTWPSQPV